MNNCSFRWKIYRLSLFFKEYVSIKNEFVEKMVRQRKTVHPFVIQKEISFFLFNMPLICFYYNLCFLFIQTYFNYFIMILFSKFIRVASATTFIFFYCYNSVKANETFAWDISLPLIFFQSFDRQREGSALIDGHLFYLLK